MYTVYDSLNILDILDSNLSLHHLIVMGKGDYRQ